MLAWLAVALPIIADNVLGYGLDQSGIGEKIREKFRRDPEKEAFQHALQNTFGLLEQRYSVLAQEDIFRASFEDKRCGRILSQLLLRWGTPNPNELAALWASVKYPQESEEYTKSLNTSLQALYQGLLDEHHDVRIASVQGLIMLARRFPDVYDTVEKMFIQGIEQKEFDVQDDIKRSAHDYAYEGLWLLIVGGEIEGEDE